MRRIFFSLALIVLSFASVLSQTAKPTATPPTPDDADIVKITTALIQVDVTVTDKNGKVITDLRPEEVEIFENGEKQKITNFSFVSNLRTVEEAPRDKNAKPSILPPAAIRPELVHRTIALVVDDLTLSFESVYFVRRALNKFVDEQMQEGDLVAIIRTGAGIGALQQFTNDRRQLHAAIEKVRWNPLGSGNIGAFAPLEPKLDTGAPATEPEAGERTAEGIQREFDDFRESVFATGTLGAVNYVVRGMQDLPGRKSIMLLSDGFKLFQEDALGFRETGRVMQNLRRLVDMANRASVVIYTMDARGLQTTGMTAQDNTGGRTIQEIQQEESSRSAKLLDTQDGLKYLARQTGGIAIVNNNDLSGGIRKILDDQSYYLVAYEPDDATFDPRTRRFNNLQIKVTRPGAQARYRSGFFGISDEKIVKPTQTIGQRMTDALTSPFGANQISLKLNALFYNSAKNGNVVRSLMHIGASDLKFSDEPDGSKKAVIDVVAIGFGDNGAVVDQTSKTYTLSLQKEAFERVVKAGFVYDFSFPVKKAGAYQLRIALHDHGSDKIGSANQFIEVPNLKKNRLILSGVVLENLTHEDWQKREAGKTGGKSDPLADTSLRQFRRGTVLNYGFTIYNAKAAGSASSLSYQTRVFRDGKPIFESAQKPVVPTGGGDPGTVGFTAALSLGSVMVPGDYVLEIAVTDNMAKGKAKTATQYVQFEIVD
ncbi:MAG TPA: VWA domain-containing protein [Pyrinomonadaceae bacterium]|nr:VWA domain-containing protein [Pyrinomonadaceae bacterium]